MDRIELKHLAPYLPHDLQLTDCDQPMNGRMCELLCSHYSHTRKPILRPIEDLRDEWLRSSFEDFQDEKDEDNWVLEAVDNGHKFVYADFQNITYRGMECLFANHFDVFGLIPADLAIDINTLGKEADNG